MSISVAVITSDMEYITRMMSYMKGSPIYHTWRLQLYSSPERINQLTELKRAHLIVVEEAFYGMLQRRIEAGGGVIREFGVDTEHGVIPIVVLTGERRAIAAHELHKYQSLSSLLHALQQRYEYYRSESQAGNRLSRDAPHCIGVCSTLEQTGKTLLALHLAALLAKRGYRVFYCNFEYWNTSHVYLQAEVPSVQGSFSDLLYLIKSKHSVKKWLAEEVAALDHYGFYTLKPFQHEADRQGLAAQDATAMLTALTESGLYDFVIVDLPAGLNQWTLPILEECAVNYMLVLPQQAWQAKHRLAMAAAKQEAAETIERLQLEGWSLMNELHGTSYSTAYRSLECLPYVEAWQREHPILLASASYRAAVERCIARLLQTEEMTGEVKLG